MMELSRLLTVASETPSHSITIRCIKFDQIQLLFTRVYIQYTHISNLTNGTARSAHLTTNLSIYYILRL